MSENPHDSQQQPETVPEAGATAPVAVAIITDPPPTPGFRIHPFLILLALGLTGVVVARGLPFAGDNPEHIGRIIGRGVGSLLGIFLLAAAAWRVCGRSAVAGNLAFVLLLLAQVGVGLNSIQTAKANANQIKHVERQTEVLRQELKTQVQSDDGLVASASTVKSLEKYAAALDEASEKMEGPDARFARVISDMTSQDAAMVKRYADALERLTDAGGGDPSTLGSRKEIDSRLALLRDLDKQNDNLVAHTRARRAKYRTAMLKEAFTEGEAGQFLNQAVPNSMTQLTLAIRKTDTEMFAAMRGQMEILRDSMGHWQADPSTLNVYFDESVPDATLDKYSELGQTIQTAGARQLELQRSLARQVGAK
jgi:hypothetical protein